MIKPVRIHVRFSDLDVMGHVNNMVYLSYFEIARVKYFGKLLGQNWDWKKNGVVLAKNEVEYLKPVFLHSEPYVHMTTKHIGSKSFILEYEIQVDGKVCTKGASTMVCFDATANETIPVPEVMKEALLKLKKV